MAKVKLNSFGGLVYSTDPSIKLSADPQEEQEHVEDVEEDGRREQGRDVDVGGATQPLEVEHDEARKDHQAEHRVDERSVRDRARRRGAKDGLAKELTGGEDGTKVERNRDGWVEVVGS